MMWPSSDTAVTSRHVGKAVRSTTHHDAPGQPLEEGVVAQLRALRGHAVIHFGQVLEACTERLADGLMAQANAQDGLAAGISPDHIEQEAGLRGDARTGAEDDTVEGLQLTERELVVAVHLYVGPKRFHQLGQVVREAVVIVYNDGFHESIFLRS